MRSHWRENAKTAGVADFDPFWTDALRVGVVPGTVAPTVNVSVRSDFTGSLAPSMGAETEITVLFRPDPFLWDGRFADNGSLQEMGRPFTRLTWDNAALVSPRTAGQFGFDSGDVVRSSRAAGAFAHLSGSCPGRPTNASRCLSDSVGALVVRWVKASVSMHIL